jgi:hypothetical protein
VVWPDARIWELAPRLKGYEPRRENTHSGRRLGSAELVKELEKLLLRRLRKQKGDRPAK